MNAGLAQLIERRTGIQLNVLAGGGLENPTHVNSADSDFGTSVDILARAAYAGMEPYEGRRHSRLRLFGRGWSSLPFHLVKRGDFRADFEEALERGELCVGVPPVGTSDELTFRRVLRHYGKAAATIVHGNYDELPVLCRRGEIDFLFGAAAAPATAIAELRKRPFNGKLLPLGAALIEALHREYGYTVGTIPVDTYPGMQRADVATLRMQTVFLVRSDVDAEVVRKLMNAILSERDSLPAIFPSLSIYDPWQNEDQLPVPPHDGLISSS